MEVSFPFRPQFRMSMLEGVKTMSARPEKMGDPGDTFKAFGTSFVITRVYRAKVGQVASYFFKREGFASEAEFWETWRLIHPRNHDPKRTVYVHEFRKNNETGDKVNENTRRLF